MFRNTLAPKEGDASKVAGYTRNLLAAMKDDVLPFSVFDFIWEKIKAISKSPLRSCAYAPYIMHMIEYVTKGQFEYDMEHVQLNVKHNVPVPRDDDSSAGVAPSAPSPSRVASGRGGP